MDTGITFLRIISPFYFVVFAKLASGGILRGIGRMKQFMAATFTYLILRVVLAKILSGNVLGTIGTWTAWPVGWIIFMIFHKKSQKEIRQNK